MKNLSETTSLQLIIDGPCATISIDRAARRNALNFAMWEAIPGLIADIEALPDIRVIVFTGIGPDFSAGADITEFEERRATPDGARLYDATTESAYDAIRNSRLPTVAAIRGACIGGGFGLAMACDIRVAQSDAIFAIPPGRLGLAYPVNSLAHITAIIGPAFAKELLFTARRIDAAAALQAGIVSNVSEGDIDEISRKYVRQISSNAPLSLRAAKVAIDETVSGVDDPRNQFSSSVRRHIEACYESDDYAEGRAAFLEKRSPVFKGK